MNIRISSPEGPLPGSRSAAMPLVSCDHRPQRRLSALAGGLSLGLSLVFGAATPAGAAPAPPALSAAGLSISARYEAELAALRAELTKAAPAIDGRGQEALDRAEDDVRKADAGLKAAQQNLGKLDTARALVEHAKGKWLGGAAKGIAQAEASLKNAKTQEDRDKANKDLAKWQADREAGLKALKERQAALDALKLDEPMLVQAHQAAVAAYAKAQAAEVSAALELLAGLEGFLTSGALDAKLVKCAVLDAATPRGLADFAQGRSEHAALVDKLLHDPALMNDMLIAGGARGGKYGRAMEIYAAIQQASPKSREGALQRLALATALEHTVPVAQSNAQSRTDAPATVDPLKRYQHYEKAFLAGELDPAFRDFNTWEYRMVVNSDAPDEILSWGREMLRAYRPEQVTLPDYGWRYVMAVRTDVSYGSQNVSRDLPELQNYQNIPLNGGVCGRRAFFGRFILRSFGIPVWGVTQHKHAAVSHWTPKGWVVNLGAGFHASWWDKDDTPRSGSDFLMETQARARGPEYLKVLRAQWVSRGLGEQAHNAHKRIAGGPWSRLAHHLSVSLASKSVELGPLGRELAEANESKAAEKLEKAPPAESDRKLITDRTGRVVVPAVAHEKPAGPFSTVKSFSGGQQMHCRGGYTSQYVIDAPRAGRYQMTARVATFAESQKFVISTNDSKQPVDVSVPFTVGLWQETPPATITLTRGRNVLHVALPQDSRGVTVREFTLKPVE